MRLYSTNDMVKADCNDCVGCSDCCRGMGESIVLDPYDIYRLTINLHQTFEEMLSDSLELHVVNGLILPNLKMVGETESCRYLNEEGRCSIHGFRPGICRLFPLGRQYEDGKLYYFVVEGECSRSHSKVKVKKWLDTPDLSKYEEFLIQWHDLRKKMEARIAQSSDDKNIKQWNMRMLTKFYVEPYQANDFYRQFKERYEVIADM